MAEAPRPILFGDYTIVERLGEGGMCHVFRAQKKGLAHDVALKLLKEDQRKDERVLDLFVTEADLSLLLRHPNLIRTYDAGEVRGRYYIAMELIEGGSLRDVAERCRRLSVPLPQDLVLATVGEVLEGLHAVHEARGTSGRALDLVHRDVTPHNVFVHFDGRVILGDFGIASIKAYGDAEPGTMLGKIGYLAPEVVAGEEIDRRADLFAVGVMLYELLTGEALYSGPDQATQVILEAIVEEHVPRPRKVRPSIARGLENVILKALARRPKDRYQTAEEMAYDLKDYWSATLAHPRAMGAFLCGLMRDEAERWRARKAAAHSLLEK